MLPVESPTPAPSAPPVVGTTEATNAAIAIVNAAAVIPALSRADIARLAMAVTTAPFLPYPTASEEVREAIPRARAEVVPDQDLGSAHRHRCADRALSAKRGFWTKSNKSAR
jgi:hypothetical protein